MMSWKSLVDQVTYWRFAAVSLACSIALAAVETALVVVIDDIHGGFFQLAVVGDPPYYGLLALGAGGLIVGLAAVGIIWSPMAVILSYAAVRRLPAQGRLPLRRRAIYSSSAMLLPWLVLQASLWNRVPRRWLSLTSHWIVLLLWLLGPILLWGIVLVVGSYPAWMILAYQVFNTLGMDYPFPVIVRTGITFTAELIWIAVSISLLSVPTWLCVRQWMRFASTFSDARKNHRVILWGSDDEWSSFDVTLLRPFWLAIFWCVFCVCSVLASVGFLELVLNPLSWSPD